MGTSANADGYYRLDNIIEGTYEVVVSVLGYRKFREELTISPGLNRFDASLIPSSVQLEQVIVTASMKESFLHASPVKVEVLTQNFYKKWLLLMLWRLLITLMESKTKLIVEFVVQTTFT